MSHGVADYLSWFGFKESPFRLSPDVDFFYPAQPHRQAYQVLRYSIQRGEGFMVLSGQAGTGKTLLLRLLIKELPKEKKTAFIVTPSVSPRGLLLLLLEELGLGHCEANAEFAILLKKFQDAVLDMAAKGQKLLILVDEAQDLPIETLEQLRLLSNIETNKEKLIQILLVGQLELKDLLSDPRLCQLTQRIVVNETLRPLNEEETRNYVLFRFSRAGRGDMQISRKFLTKLYSYTGGLPRLVNRIMDRALLMAAASGRHILLENDLDAAASTLPAPVQIEKRTSRRKRPYAAWAGISAIFLLLVWGGIFLGYISVPFNWEVIKKNTFHSNEGGAVRNPGEIVISSDDTPIYQYPLKKSKILTIAKKGEKFQIIASQGPWYLVRLNKCSSQKECVGWLEVMRMSRSKQ